VEHVPTGRSLHGRGVDISIRGMQICVLTKDAQLFQRGDYLYLHIDPDEEDYIEALDSLSLPAKIVHIWPSNEIDGYTNIGLMFMQKLIPSPTPDGAENLHK
jgi:hypothetical protein